MKSGKGTLFQQFNQNFGFSNELVNHFSDEDGLFAGNIRDLIDKYSRIEHDNVPPIRKLLAALQNFDSYTHPDFQDERVQGKLNAADYNQFLSNMEKALDEAESERDNLPEGTLPHTVMSAAIKYSLRYTNNRIKELKKSKDPIYSIFKKQDKRARELLTVDHVKKMRK